uniref:Pogo transposable element derived with ZNF domain a n=1 Tax=Poecilia formosa TaxID=48698 RepID=A0A096LY95_POEFO
MCSPAIAEALINLRRQRIKRRRRERERRKALRLSKAPPVFHRDSPVQPVLSPIKAITPPRRIPKQSGDVQSEELSSPTSPTLSPPTLEKFLPVDYPPSKLVIMVEDFFYGRAPGCSTDKDSPDEKFGGVFHCIHCPAVLSNNIQLMDHIQQHVLSQEDGHGDSVSTCPHCFRHYPSPFSLQSHIKDVHSQSDSAVICKICEVAFDNEPALLCHMKSTHKPGEMPYTCQVCEFRSSFYSETWSHFREDHCDTRELLCQYCLRVLHTNSCYQQHVARHQKKQTLSCDKCRLHFLYVRERAEHKALHHKTHVTPPQLSGLKPGTKVTVRMYSIIGSEKKDELDKVYIPSKAVLLPPVTVAPWRNSQPYWKLTTESCFSDFDPSQRCIECLKTVPDLEIHFPTRVHCSFCKFATCCSNSYANHMINNHTTWKDPQFPAVFQLNPRLPQALKCNSCKFTTFNGDAMANHVTQKPDHVCIMLTDEGICTHCIVMRTCVLFVLFWTFGVNLIRFAFFHTERSSKQPENQTFENQTSVNQMSGNQMSGNETTGNRTSENRTSENRTSENRTSENRTSENRTSGNETFGNQMSGNLTSGNQMSESGAEERVGPLSHDQLCVVLSSLCHGINETARRTNVSPTTIRSWIALQQRGLAQRRWGWKSDKMAEWVLNRREQQLSVTETVLLLTARAALGESTQVEDCYSWTIDFMLRHDLGLQTTNNNRLKSIRENSNSFIQSIHSLVQKGALPLHCWGCMDELPVFIDSDLFSKQQASAFQLFGSPEDEPVFDIVLSALSDGRLLPPLLYFRGTASSVPDGFPDNVLLEAREGGFRDEERLRIWVDKVWRPYVTSRSGDRTLLVMDVHRGHLSKAFRDSLSAVNTHIAFIPAGCSCRLQPLEICVTQVLRDFLQARWSQLIADGGLDGLGLDQLALTLACWLSEVCSTLNAQTDVLRRSFTLACSLQHLENQGEAARMITALTEVLTQPLDSGSPEPRPKQERLLERTPPQPPLLVINLSALRQVFNSESDAESFHGFADV